MRFFDERWLMALTAAFSLALLAAAPVEEQPAELDGTAELANMPTVTFFYYDGAGVEWVVSAEAERFQQHLASNPESQGLFEAVSSAVIAPPENSGSAAQMTRWIEAERTRFEQTRREAVRMRMAEAVIAYLRDHDFDIQKLVESIKRRSGASEVELAAIHLRDRQGESSFKLKVVLVHPSIEVGKQGFNIDLPSANVTYTTVVYALGVALYEVQEIIHGNKPSDDAQPDDTIEQLPTPEPLDTRQPRRPENPARATG